MCESEIIQIAYIDIEYDGKKKSENEKEPKHNDIFEIAFKPICNKEKDKKFSQSVRCRGFVCKFWCKDDTVKPAEYL